MNTRKVLIGSSVAVAVLARQHEVEHHQIEARALHQLRHGAAVGGGLDADLVLLQEARHEVADLGVVVDDQDVGRARHGPIIGTPPRRARILCNAR